MNNLLHENVFSRYTNAFTCKKKGCNCENPDKPFTLKGIETVDFTIKYVCSCECHGQKRKYSFKE